MSYLETSDDGRSLEPLTADAAALHWILRVAVAACFIGHGAFGIITKAAWLPYFAIFGIPEAWAWRLMPVVGTVDITVGVLTLFQPVRAIILYMAFWGFQTACLRPLTGQGVWELLERAGNYGVPLAFLVLLGPGRSPRDWFSTRPMPTLTRERALTIRWILRATTALLLIGHAGFDFAMHKDWSGYAAAIGISPATVASPPRPPSAGWRRCAHRRLVPGWPARGLLICVFAWKLGTEALRPLAGEPLWEFIERGGSYGAPLALAWLQGQAWNVGTSPRSTRRASGALGPSR
jgi:hypothetical protein